jgi:hypothetical protein
MFIQTNFCPTKTEFSTLGGLNNHYFKKHSYIPGSGENGDTFLPIFQAVRKTDMTNSETKRRMWVNVIRQQFAFEVYTAMLPATHRNGAQRVPTGRVPNLKSLKVRMPCPPEVFETFAKMFQLKVTWSSSKIVVTNLDSTILQQILIGRPIFDVSEEYAIEVLADNAKRRCDRPTLSLISTPHQSANGSVVFGESFSVQLCVKVRFRRHAEFSRPLRESDRSMLAYFAKLK